MVRRPPSDQSAVAAVCSADVRLRPPRRQTLAIAWISFRSIATSWAGLALLAAIPLLTVPVVLDQMESGGVPLVPATALVINELTAPLSAELSRWVIVPLLIVFFAGELVWRERDAGLSEIIDAMPGSEWAPLPRQVPGTRSRARRVHGTPDDGRNAGAGDHWVIRTSRSGCT